MTLVSANIKFCGCSWGFPGEDASNDSEVGLIENVDFECFRMLRLRNLGK